MSNYKNLYLKYKNKYVKLKQQQKGGNDDSTDKSYTAKISIPLFKNNPEGIVIGEISVSKKDSYDQILGKINKVLDKETLANVNDFHYMTEDGDISYVNKDLISDNGLYDAIEFDTTFFVYYNY